MPSCIKRATPRSDDYGGCLPCPAVPLGSTELEVAAIDAACVRCLLSSGRPFFIGRPGMGAPEEVACALATHRTRSWNDSESSAFWIKERYLLRTLNGVSTASDEDARTYARCYFAAINASDIIVRIGGGRNMPLRKPFTACTKMGTKHFHKTDVLLSQSGHLDRGCVVSHYVLNPWMLVADAQHPYRRLVNTSASGWASDGSGNGETVGGSIKHSRPMQLTEEAFSWIQALRGRTVLIVHPFAQR